MSEIYQPAEDSYFLSEVLKKYVSKSLKNNSNLKVLEIGCGSGIQLNNLLTLKVKKQNIFSCDINPEAVKHCKNLGFNSIKSYLFSNIKDKFDLIIFNPPYLPENKFDNQKDTSGGKKGDEIILKFLKQLKKHMNKNGKCFLLLSSLTPMKKISQEFKNFKTKKLETKKLFFEELYVFELS